MRLLAEGPHVLRTTVFSLSRWTHVENHTVERLRHKEDKRETSHGKGYLRSDQQRDDDSASTV